MRHDTACCDTEAMQLDVSAARVTASVAFAGLILLASLILAANDVCVAQGVNDRIHAFEMPVSRLQPAGISLAGPAGQRATIPSAHEIGAFQFMAIDPVQTPAPSPAVRDTVPHPRKVMFRSMILPGWGQVTNRQIWKVPLVYGLLGGMTFYSISSHNSYTDYRAAYYNAASGNDDQRFGPTPGYLAGAPLEALRFNRNFYRNRRDFSFILIGLAYGLNILDAYVFAHFRDFDVSDDLSSRYTIQPDPFGNPYLSVSYRIRF